MDRVNFKKNLFPFLKKNKYVVMILIVGVVLMMIPTGGSDPQPTQVTSAPVPAADLEEELSRILGKIQGCGKVEVLLTQAGGERTVFQTDETSNYTGGNGSTNTKTVIIGDNNRGQQGLIQQRLAPTWLGAVIVCQGGDDPKVRLSIVEAVSKATGLSSDKITVLKMK